MGVLILTRIIRVDPFNPSDEAIKEAAMVIRRGGLVAFPTETVYGLGANALDEDAVVKIFRAKKRPMDNPLIVHIASRKQLYMLARDLPEKAVVVAERLWPGPVTIVVWKSDIVPDVVTAGLPKVAIRMPAHPVALKLIEYSGVPIAAPSANLAGRPSPTRAEHVIEDLYGVVDVIIDGGETLLGIESTVIDLTRDPPVLLRPGSMPIEKIEEILGTRIVIPGFARGLGKADRAVSPGTRYKHYAPRTPLVLVEATSYDDLEEYSSRVLEIAFRYQSDDKRVCILASRETSDKYRGAGFMVLEVGSRGNLYEVAKNLFDALRRLDKLGVDIAVAEGFEEKGLGIAIMNRLRKASGENIIKV